LVFSPTSLCINNQQFIAKRVPSLAPLLVLSPTSLCINNQQFIAKRVLSLKNQLVYGSVYSLS